jgi:hypothetical protein
MLRNILIAGLWIVGAGQASGCALLGIYGADDVERGMTYDQVRSLLGRPDEEHKSKTTLGDEIEWVYHINAETCSITFNFDRVLKPPRCQTRQKREQLVELNQVRMNKRKWLDAQNQEQKEWELKRKARYAQRSLAGLPPLLREPKPDSPRDPIQPNLREAVEAAYPTQDPKQRRSLFQVAKHSR